MRNRSVMVGGIALVAAGCAGRSSAPPAPEPAGPPDPIAVRDTLPTLCEDLTNAYECGLALEAYQLGRRPDVERRGDTLVLRLSADTVTLTDRDVADDTGVRYTYWEFIDGVGYHVIQVHAYEGTAFHLVSHQTGDGVRVHAPPVFSPDGRRFATASEDLESRYNPTAIQIWRMADGAARLEWSHEPAGDPVTPSPDAWGPADLRWRSATEIDVQRVTFDPRTSTRAVGDRVVIRLVDGRWQIRGD